MKKRRWREKYEWQPGDLIVTEVSSKEKAMLLAEFRKRRRLEQNADAQKRPAK